MFSVVLLLLPLASITTFTFWSLTLILSLLVSSFLLCLSNATALHLILMVVLISSSSVAQMFENLFPPVFINELLDTNSWVTLYSLFSDY